MPLRWQLINFEGALVRISRSQSQMVNRHGRYSGVCKVDRSSGTSAYSFTLRSLTPNSLSRAGYLELSCLGSTASAIMYSNPTADVFARRYKHRRRSTLWTRLPSEIAHIPTMFGLSKCMINFLSYLKESFTAAHSRCRGILLRTTHKNAIIIPIFQKSQSQITFRQ